MTVRVVDTTLPDRRVVVPLVAAAGLVAGWAVVAGLVLHTLTAGSATAAGVTDWWLWLTVTGVVYTGVGAWLAVARPDLPVGWVLLGTGLLGSVALGSLEYGVWAVGRGDTGPLATALLWMGNWVWSAALLTVGAVLPTLLPEGRPVRSRRPIMVFGVAAVVLAAVGQALAPYESWSPALAAAGTVNPVGVAWVAGEPQTTVAGAFSAGMVLLSWATLVVGWRRAPGPHRRQLTWIVLGGCAAVLLGVVGNLTVPAFTAFAMVPLPVAVAVAVLRHGLWDVDVVVSRALVYTLLAVAVGGVYVGCVALLSAVTGSGTGAVVLAAAVVALGVEPAHRRLRVLVNRVVFGEPDDPPTVLGDLGRRLDGARDADVVARHLLPEVVTTVAGVLRLPYVAVVLSDGALAEHGVRDAPLVERELVYGGAPVGRLLVTPRPPGLGRWQQRQLDRLAGPAAVAAHTVLLAHELARARAHLVSAREEERRLLYRELHDGLGPTVAALALQTETARDLLSSDPDRAAALLTAVVPRLRGTVGAVRSLVDGLRPPALDHLGLAGSVRELCDHFDGPALAVSADVEDVDGLPAAVEVATYRIVAEALTNVVRHAGAGVASVSLRGGGAGLVVTVEDDGRGCADAVAGTGWTSMRCRADELGGRLSIGSGPRGGTLVVVRLPLGEPPCAS